METLLLVALFIPLVSFFLLVGLSRSLTRSSTGLIASGALLISFLCFVTLFVQSDTPSLNVKLFDWIDLPYLPVTFSLTLDELSLWMGLIVTGVGFLIHVYSNGYMDHDEHFIRFFAFLNFFVFAMLLLILGADLLVLFIGWEGVGLASYLLIGFWTEKSSATKAAKKAFVMNRIGDLGLLLGIIFAAYLFGTTHISEINANATKLGFDSTAVTVLTLLFFVGAVGKSAQLPLTTWLPDAMEGPTPVSALIHAATMVTAGIYLIVRLNGLFDQAPFTLQVIGAVGAATALYGSLAALAQTDLKRVLAFSTVSQLGLMFMACGAGAYFSAMFHLTTHAFTKALLFLSAGIVVHLLHGKTQMENMGGLSKIFTKTRWLFLIGVLALAGIPPFAPFFSKDLILEQEFISGHPYLFTVGLIASILTAFYMMRAYCLTFLGPLKPENENAQEGPFIMTAPVSVLALLATFGGGLGLFLEHFLDIRLTHAEEELNAGFIITPETWLAVGGAVAGLVAAYLIYTRYQERLGNNWTTFKNAFYLNEIYAAVVVAPVSALAKMIARYIEPKGFEGSMGAVASSTMSLAHGVTLLQSGQIRSYVAWMAVGAALLLLALI